MNRNRKCKNCDGIGIVGTKEKNSECLYCRGKGYRSSFYGRDESLEGLVVLTETKKNG